jgi:hypothetical protein
VRVGRCPWSRCAGGTMRIGCEPGRVHSMHHLHCPQLTAGAHHKRTAPFCPAMGGKGLLSFGVQVKERSGASKHSIMACSGDSGPVIPARLPRRTRSLDVRSHQPMCRFTQST